MKNILSKIFNPNKFIGVPIFIFSTILIIYVLSFDIQRTILSYIAYLLSTYALILLIIWSIKVFKLSSKKN